MFEPLRVLSLFDGISCGRLALERAGIPIKCYVASEINSYAIKVSRANWPDIWHVGDAKNLHFEQGYFDLIIGGSPCQGFSQAGLGLNFDDPRSALFFEFERIVKEVKPKWFLLENVKMSNKCLNVISERLAVKPKLINSSLVSAQNRKRYYWTNINYKIPEDKNIMLKSIIGPYEGIKVLPRGGNSGGIQHYFGKSPCITSSSWEHNFKPVINGIPRMFTPQECEQLQTLPINYTLSVPFTHRYKLLGQSWTVDVIAHIFKGLLI